MEYWKNGILEYWQNAQENDVPTIPTFPEN
jgi:hypothetical protein